jgi:DtxR family manganese transport transcriptional regulator
LTARKRSFAVQEEASQPDAPEQATRFSRARSARSAEILEDYTELIADLLQECGEARITDIAGRLGVAHPTATKAVARLKREGLVVSRPYRSVFLTPLGEEMAQRVKARHRLVVELLLALGVPPEAAETDAEGMEHYVSDVTLAALETFLKSRK